SLVASVAGLLAVSIAAIMAYAFRRSVVVPLQRLTSVAERVTAGDLAARAQVQSHDEIGVLASSINTMTERLWETIRHLESVFAEAQRAKASAEVASRAKSSFLANMSHELRTPLNAVLGYAQILEDEPGLSDLQRHGLATIRRGGEQLLSQISDVLDLSRIQAGKVELVLQPVGLPELLQEVEGTMGAAARQKGLTLVCEFAPDLPASVRVDGPRLQQVLIKLLGNAVKFTERGQVRLQVHGRQAADGTQTRLHFEVADSGIGIPPEHVAMLFRPFEQAGDTQRQYGGTGLGLAICQQVVSMMGGSIQVQSELGKGSVFRFELDVELAVARPAPECRPQAPIPSGAEAPPQRSRRGGRAQAPAAAALPASALVVPAADELELLHALARMGNMRSLGERAEYLARLDPVYQPFADRLRELAQRFQSRAILDWISDLRAGAQDDANAPVRGTNAGL
ncbi:MAG: ATP-binding protein, partial [Vitreoscilla sp.]